MKRFQYAVLLTAAEEGGYIVTCRDLPPLITQGEDREEALAQAADAMEEVFAVYMTNHMDFPEPSPAQRDERLVAPPPDTLAKAALYVAMREAGVSPAQLAQQLGVKEKEIDRMLDPRTGSKWPRIAEAIHRLGQRLVIGLEPA